MMRKLDTLAGLPGQAPVAWRPGRGSRVVATLAAVAWPPLVLTLLFWPPHNWMPGAETDWRLALLVIGLIAVPLGLRVLAGERERTGRPTSRLGIIWRFMLYGGLLAAGLQILFALVMIVLGLVQSGGIMEGIGSTETMLLIYGVGGLPLAILVGVSYALWAGICVAFLAFQPAPTVRDRLGVMNRDVTAN